MKLSSLLLAVTVTAFTSPVVALEVTGAAEHADWQPTEGFYQILTDQPARRTPLAYYHCDLHSAQQKNVGRFRTKEAGVALHKLVVQER